MKPEKCIVCKQGFRTKEGLERHQWATSHRIKDCECHCHCLERIKKGGKCSCEKYEQTVQCRHCENPKPIE